MHSANPSMDGSKPSTALTRPTLHKFHRHKARTVRARPRECVSETRIRLPHVVLTPHVGASGRGGNLFQLGQQLTKRCGCRQRRWWKCKTLRQGAHALLRPPRIPAGAKHQRTLREHASNAGKQRRTPACTAPATHRRLQGSACALRVTGSWRCGTRPAPAAAAAATAPPTASATAYGLPWLCEACIPPHGRRHRHLQVTDRSSFTPVTSGLCHTVPAIHIHMHTSCVNNAFITPRCFDVGSLGVAR